MHFSLNTSMLQVNIKTNEKYIFISGFSGAGKSLFVAKVERVTEFAFGT